MELLDPFSRTFLPAATAAMLSAGTVRRHVDVLRQCVGDRDSVLLVAPCTRSNRPSRPGVARNLLLLTRHRLVVTTESAILRRLRLYLNADLSHLTDVTWSPEPDQRAMQFAATAVDGVREHFRITFASVESLWQLDTSLRTAFNGPWAARRPAQSGAGSLVGAGTAAPGTAGQSHLGRLAVA